MPGNNEKGEEMRLDPKPWREMMTTDGRFTDRATTPEYVALVFDPRAQYSQNPEDYR